jgi:rubrerythrin
MMIPDIIWGNEPDIDWREALANDEELDDDDELEKTPEDVLQWLGFDPLDEKVDFEEKESGKIQNANLIEAHPDDSQATSLRNAIAAEIDAINLYEKIAEQTDNEDLRKLLLSIADEEKVHIGEFESLLQEIDQAQKEDLEKGGKEAEKIENQIDLEILPEPTEAQARSGNYRKHHITVHGLDISIENPKGSTRRGKDKDGNEWVSVLPEHYGYLRRTEGADSEHVDCYVGPHEESDKVFIIDQVDPESEQFDEHKAMIGFDTQDEAQKAYLDAFSDGRGHDRIGSITEMPVDEFKQWLKDGDTKKPFAFRS